MSRPSPDLVAIGSEFREAIRSLDRLGDPVAPEGELVVAAEHEYLALRAAALPAANCADHEQALAHLDRLEMLLTESLYLAADRCHVIADALAVREEHDIEIEDDDPAASSVSVVELEHRFRSEAAQRQRARREHFSG